MFSNFTRRCTNAACFNTYQRYCSHVDELFSRTNIRNFYDPLNYILGRVQFATGVFSNWKIFNAAFCVVPVCIRWRLQIMPLYNVCIYAYLSQRFNC